MLTILCLLCDNECCLGIVNALFHKALFLHCFYIGTFSIVSILLTWCYYIVPRNKWNNIVLTKKSQWNKHLPSLRWRGGDALLGVKFEGCMWWYSAKRIYSVGCFIGGEVYFGCVFPLGWELNFLGWYSEFDWACCNLVIVEFVYNILELLEDDGFVCNDVFV